MLINKRINQFCSHSCSAAFNNKGVRRHGVEAINCLQCNNITHNNKFCSHSCRSIFNWQKIKTELLSCQIDRSSANYVSKKYLTELHSGKCQICTTDRWQDKPMPLVLDHINGNPYDNSLNNLRVICHNCNAQTPTFAGRNKGNGRVERAKRYKIEKQIINDMNADIV